MGENLEINNIKDSAKCLADAIKVTLNINSELYEGAFSAVNEQVGVFKVNALRASLNELLPGKSAGRLWAFQESGEFAVLPAVVLKTKLPAIVIKMPEAETEKIERKPERFAMKVPVGVTLTRRMVDNMPEKNSDHGKMVEVSQVGYRLQTPLALTEKDRVQINIPCSNGKIQMLDGDVINRLKMTPKSNSFGILFARLEPELKAFLEKYIKGRSEGIKEYSKTLINFYSEE